jgi:hypothetical protein
VWLLPGFVFGAASSRKRVSKLRWRVLFTLEVTVLLILLMSCAGVSSGSGGGGSPPANPVTYKVTVTGTSAGTPPDPGQSTVVTLVVD